MSALLSYHIFVLPFLSACAFLMLKEVSYRRYIIGSFILNPASQSILFIGELDKNLLLPFY